MPQITITLGWWLAPSLVTLIAFGWAQIMSGRVEPSHGGGYMPDMTPLVWAFYYAIALFASLIAWFVWAVLT